MGPPQADSDNNKLVSTVVGITLGVFPLVAFYGATFAANAWTDNNSVVRAAAQISLSVGMALLGPTVVRRVINTYDAPADVAARLLALCEAHRVAVRGVGLYPGQGKSRANALFVGIVPSRRYVFVSDYIVNNFPEPELEAVMAHESCHGREHHLLIRVGILIAGLVLLNATEWGGLLYFGLIVGLNLLDPYVEMRADDYAARTVGAEQMVAALIRLGVANSDSFKSRSFGFGGHPGLARRIERLGGAIPDVLPEPAEPSESKERKPKLSTPWRVALPVVWVGVLAIATNAGIDEQTIDYPPIADVLWPVALILLLVVPIAAMLGWRWSPHAGIVGALAALPPSYTDMRHPLPSGRLEFASMLALLVVGIVAARSPLVVRPAE